MRKKYIALLLSLAIITGCTTTNPTGKIIDIPNASTTINIPQTRKIVYPQPAGTVTTENNTVFLELVMPKRSFETKALEAENIKYFRVTLTDSEGRVYFPSNVIHDADPNKDNLLTATDGKVRATFNNVKFDDAVYVKLVAFDIDKVEIPGSELSTAFAYKTSNKKLEISYRTTPVGEVIEKLLEIGTKEALEIAKDILKGNDLEKFIDEITGVQGKLPNYTYTLHPSLVDTDAIVAALLGNGGDIKKLDPEDPAFRIEPTTVSGIIAGLVSTDQVSIQVTDIISQILIDQGNGAFERDVVPGIWKTKITLEEGAGTTYTVTSPLATDASTDVNLGTITLTPATPAINLLTPTTGKKDGTVTIDGSNFHANIDGNVVKFGSVTSTVNASTNAQLTTTVPDGIFGAVKVTASVGTQTSNEMDFAVIPDITSLTSSGAIGSEITINGTGFDSVTKTNNIVTIGGQNATVNSATNHELKVVVPADIFGNVNVTVQVGTQLSNTVTFDVTPELTTLSKTDLLVNESVDINGTGFDFNTSTNNKVFFGSTPVTVDSATATKLTVKAPFAANDNVTVKVGTKTSNGLGYFILPEITFDDPDEGTTHNGTVTLKATVTSPNSISKVEFFENGGLIGAGIANVNEYSFDWNTLSPTYLTGAKALTAKVTDIAAKTATTTPAVNITLDQIPIINSITPGFNPVSGLGYPVDLTADVTDDGTVSYTWSTLGGTFGTFSDQSGNNVIWRAPGTAGGPYTIQLEVDDGVNAPVTQTISIRVSDGSAEVDVTGGAH
jgi:hypothetical protein